MYERNLIEYLPEGLRNVKENHAILTVAEQPEMVNLWDAMDDVLKDQFILDATENGVSRFEAIMKVVPKADQSLDERKFALLTKNNEQVPFTIASLEQRLGLLCGEGGYEVSRDVKNKVLNVSVALAAKHNYTVVEELLERIVPVNMTINLSLKYNRNSAVAEYTHGGLEEFTHDQIRNKVI